MRERSPRHATLVSPVTATWRDVSRRLGSDAAFIEYLVSDSGSLAFVVARDTVGVVDLGVRRRDLAGLSSSPAGRLQRKVDRPPDCCGQGPLSHLRRTPSLP